MIGASVCLKFCLAYYKKVRKIDLRYLAHSIQIDIAKISYKARFFVFRLNICSLTDRVESKEL